MLTHPLSTAGIFFSAPACQASDHISQKKSFSGKDQSYQLPEELELAGCLLAVQQAAVG